MKKSDRAGDDVKEGIVCLRCVGLVIANVRETFALILIRRNSKSVSQMDALVIFVALTPR